ncbi:hypothetical protein E2320_016379, partial [Naja naja]
MYCSKLLICERQICFQKDLLPKSLQMQTEQ